jgi:DEAD/DEAH box helicase domain-containing protein
LAAHRDDPRCVHVEHLPSRPARHGELGGASLDEQLAGLVPPGGLWSHQATAVDLIRAGRSVVIATPTASGKSLAYRLPIAEAVSAPLRPATSLLLFPTKALAQDQLRSLVDLEVPRLVAATYDGDCTTEERQWVRQHANVLLTNPEMLHHGLLPNHRRWATFLGRLRYVVVDELHVLRGVFGAHVAHLLRRLSRLADRYGADPTFVFCSATIGEPGRLASELCGREVVEVTDDGSPRGDRHVVLWDREAPGGDGRGSTTAEATDVAASLVESGLRTLVFCRSRRSTELVAERLRARFADRDPDRIRAYRSGYLPEERREIEDELFAGRLDAVVATSALELGVDIGGLDAVVLCGYPGTVASMWQQIGRAGRGAQPSVAVLVAGDDQLDRWVMAHPSETFRRPPERAVTNAANPLVVDAQLACAAHEAPLAPHDDRYWGAVLDDGVLRGVVDDWLALRRRGAWDLRAVWSGRGWPASGVNLRSASRGEHRIVDGSDQLIGTVDDARVHEQTHPGAIYLHQGRAWRVESLDPDAHLVRVAPDPGDTYTQARSETSIRLLSADVSRPVERATLTLGSVEVTHHVTGYQTKRCSDHHTVGRHELDLPPSQLRTRAVWYVVEPDVVAAAGIAATDVGAALHAIEHAAIGILPLFAICDRWDVGGISTEHLADTGRPTIVIYDGYSGGAGIAELAWEAADRHLAATLSVIERCGCDAGCPSCVQSPKCGNWNDRLDKAGAARLLRALLHH